MNQYKFDAVDYWKAIVLFGLNTATYKMGLAKTLIELAEKGETTVSWDELAKLYFKNYKERIIQNDMPQLSQPGRNAVIENIVRENILEKLNDTEAIERVSNEAFKDVIMRFHNVGQNKEIAKDKFYSYEYGKKIILHDDLLSISDKFKENLNIEIDSRWNLLEGAFLINRNNWSLSNDLRDIYLQDGTKRKSLTNNIPFLQGYQGNVCFYCGEQLDYDEIHVDHLLPRQVIRTDDIWNLVLSHATCNLDKSDKIVDIYYIEKLYNRNENIMGSNHPWKDKIKAALGDNPIKRRRSLMQHYENVKSILGNRYWGGVKGYIPENDPFYRRLITILNSANKI